MLCYLTYQDETSAKFWQISVNGNNHTVTFGRIGTAGQSKTKTFDDETSCQEDAQKLIKAKKAKGYQEDGTPAEMPTINTNHHNTKKDKTAIFTEFDEMIKNGDLNQIIPFLNTHKQGNISELKKRLNKARHYYLDWQDLSNNGKTNWGIRGDANHQRMLFCLALGLFSASDFNTRWFNCFNDVLNYMNDPEFYTIYDKKNNKYQMIFDIIKHFEFKDVFNAFFNEVIKQERILDYWLLRKLETAHLIDYHAQIFANALVNTMLPNRKDWQNLVSLPIYKHQFLKLDIPNRDLISLFDYETSIYWRSFWGVKEQPHSTNGEYWLYFIPEYIKLGKLERQFVLEKCLEIQSNLWKQNSKKFFKDLFITLKPSDDELLNLQEHLFVLLYSNNKVAINFAIDTIKSIINHKDFKLKEFLSYLNPIMINIEYKGTIKNLIILFDKLLKQNHKLIIPLSSLLSHVLFVSDLSLQERAIKLLVKYANSEILGDEWENLHSHIESIFHSLPNDIQNLLTPIYKEENTPQKNNITELLTTIHYHYNSKVTIDYFSDHKKITLYQDFNDLLFNFGQLEYSKNPVDIEIFMASWLHLKPNQLFTDNNLEQVKSVLEKYRHKYSENLLFNLFKIDFLNAIFENTDEKINLSDYYFKQFKFLKSYQAVIQQFIWLHQQNIALPLLSTPTHFPAFIEPKILVERLIAYQNANIMVDLTDYAVALARMPRVNIEPAILLLEQLDNELILESLKLAFGLIELTETLPSPHQSQLMRLKSVQENIDTLNADVNKKQKILEKNSENPHIKQGLLDTLKQSINNTLKIFDGKHKESFYQGWRGVFATIVKTHYPHIILDFNHTDSKLFDKIIINHEIGLDYRLSPVIEREYDWNKGKWFDIQTGQYTIQFQVAEYFRHAHSSDIYRQSCYYIGKNNYIYIDSLIIHILLLAKYLMPINQTDYDKFLSSYLFYDDNALNKHTLPLLERLMNDDYPYNTYTQFILVACLFAKDKVVRLAGLDTIIYAITQFKLDIELFSCHSSQWINYTSAPFSRYLECVQSLSQYEPIYQTVLLEIIEKTLILLDFKDKLPTHFKKYLEIYYLLLNNLSQKPSDKIVKKIHEFLLLSNGLKTIVNKIDKLSH
ncbi:DUF6493 family protein [Moraxella oblonga]|uniref:DUF6493 family protein n=1 Tax=Moraxella oblonga TaxID=200413 RepID=UPI00082DD8F2|nr:DUF6493 family protein [Moraxella oblonga]